jgi:hypothetical protein
MPKKKKERSWYNTIMVKTAPHLYIIKALNKQLKLRKESMREKERESSYQKCPSVFFSSFFFFFLIDSQCMMVGRDVGMSRFNWIR